MTTDFFNRIFQRALNGRSILLELGTMKAAAFIGHAARDEPL